MLFTVADGMDDPLLKARAPFDLLVANILAGPLAEMAQDFAAAVTPGGSIVLAGLLETQEEPAKNEVTTQYARDIAGAHARQDARAQACNVCQL